MRVRLPHRILFVGLVLGLLCVLPAVTPAPSSAKPVDWKPGPGSDPPPSGDGDGTIVKARSVGGTLYEATPQTSATSKVTTRRTWSLLRMYLSLVRWGFGYRWGGF